MDTTPYDLIYVTAPNREVALTLGREMVSSRLAACANVLDGMTSVYWWNGTVNEDTESVLILKTRRERVPDLIREILARHPYECPCIVALPIVNGNQSYLDWLGKETM